MGTGTSRKSPNDRKWFEEKLLQRYWVENCKKFRRSDGTRILSGRYNRTFDRYPDTYCTLESGEEVPVEVEWRTSDFDRHKHDITELKNNNGFLVVVKQDKNFELEQILISQDEFTKWFESNSKTIATDTLSSVTKKKSARSYPKLWLYYVSGQPITRKNFEISLQMGIWGVPGKKKFGPLKKYQDIQKGDLITFVRSWNAPKDAKGGRIPFEKFRKGGNIEQVSIFRVSEGYHYDETMVWPEKDGEVWPHRIKFETKSLLNLEDVNIRKLGGGTQTILHRLISHPFNEGEPFHLIDMMSYSK